jgi:hypothetical protein
MTNWKKIYLNEDKPRNDYEALVLALQLAVSAPTDEKAKETVALAESLAATLTELEVARAKRQAEKNIKELEGS